MNQRPFGTSSADRQRTEATGHPGTSWIGRQQQRQQQAASPSSSSAFPSVSVLETLTQDCCIGWDESRNVDLRTLATSPAPAGHTPRQRSVWKTPSTTSSSSSSAFSDHSISEDHTPGLLAASNIGVALNTQPQKGIFPTSVVPRQRNTHIPAEQEIDGIFRRLQQKSEQPSSPHASASKATAGPVALMQIPTQPVSHDEFLALYEDDAQVTKSTTTTTNPDMKSRTTTSPVELPAGISRKRLRRDLSLQQKAREQQPPLPLAHRCRMETSHNINHNHKLKRSLSLDRATTVGGGSWKSRKHAAPCLRPSNTAFTTTTTTSTNVCRADNDGFHELVDLLLLQHQQQEQGPQVVELVEMTTFPQDPEEQQSFTDEALAARGTMQPQPRRPMSAPSTKTMATTATHPCKLNPLNNDSVGIGGTAVNQLDSLFVPHSKVTAPCPLPPLATNSPRRLVHPQPLATLYSIQGLQSTSRIPNNHMASCKNQQHGKSAMTKTDMVAPTARNNDRGQYNKENVQQALLPFHLSIVNTSIVKPDCNSTTHRDDVFDDWGDISMEDLAEIDSLVLAATQRTSSPIAKAVATRQVTTTRRDTLNSDSAVPEETAAAATTAPLQNVLMQAQTCNSRPVVSYSNSLSNPSSAGKRAPGTHQPIVDRENLSDDPFGDFPDIDFDELDKTIHSKATTSAIAPPNGVVRNPQWETTTQSRSNLSCSRYQVVGYDEDAASYTKILFVVCWTTDMLQQKINDRQVLHRFTEVIAPLEPSSLEQQGDQTASSSKVDGMLLLRGEWFHTRVAAGDIIHVCSLTGAYRTDVDALPLILHTCPPPGSDPNDDLVLVVHPDLLLTPTAISETVACTRRAVLRNRLGSTGLTSQAPLLGTLRHGLFEETMKVKDFSVQTATSHVQNIVRRNAEGILACQISSHDAEREVIKVLPQIQRFARESTAFGGATRNLDRYPLLESPVGKAPLRLVATEVEAIEEPIISPQLGLKGNIDLIVQALLSSTDSRFAKPIKTLVGIELKTGHIQNVQHAHMAQLALYVLMMRARYGATPLTTATGDLSDGSYSLSASDTGLLLYLNNEGLRAVPIAPMIGEMKSLIGSRNEVAIEQVRSLRPRGVVVVYEEDEADANARQMMRIRVLEPTPTALPAVINSPHACNRCYMNRECMVYQAAAKATQISSDRLVSQGESNQDLLKQFTGNLSKEDLDYFTKWDRLIDLEADAGAFLAAEAWLIDSTIREKETSRCISSVVFDASSSKANGLLDESGAWKSIISFRRSHTAPLRTPISYLNFERGCHVIVSSDTTTLERPYGNALRVGRKAPQQMHIVRGYFYLATDEQVQILALSDDMKRLLNMVERKTDSNVLFRLDRDEVATGVGTLRQNLINFLTGDAIGKESKTAWMQSTRVAKLRDFIIRLRPPVYNRCNLRDIFHLGLNGNASRPEIPGCSMAELAKEFNALNRDQQHAIEKVLASQDYCIIQGLPGSGKTSTIAFVARLLAALGKRVLITSYTHAAVDNVMLKLMATGITSTSNLALPALVRIGKKSSCHQQVQSILASSIAMQLESAISDHEVTSPTAEWLKKCISSASIIGVTVLSVPRSPVLLGESFDVVIIDEAGQISQPAIIGALMAADKFVLVGDHMQLPPLTVSEAACQAGFDVSMIKHLADQNPNSVAPLTLQYRMNEAICALSNDIVYKGKLQCASDVVRYAMLSLSSFPGSLGSCQSVGGMTWVQTVIDPRNAAVFIDTDKIRMNPAGISSKGHVDDAASQGLERSGGRGAGGRIVNNAEACLVKIITQGLIACGLPAMSVGIISPFRAQIRLIDESGQLRELQSQGLEISTIDRYQGRDKPAIVISFVRSNAKGKVGRLLEDFRRLNVALTRAKYKLIMIGSYSTLYAGSEVLRPVLDRVKSKQQVIEIPSADSLTILSCMND